MPDWPKSILTFGANVLTARTAIRLRRRDRAASPQRRAFRKLIARLGATAYWREAGIEAGMSYDAFRSRVAPGGHAAIAPAVAQMQQGKSDVLWPGACSLFVSSSGTANGSERNDEKVLPVTAEMLAHFRAGCRDTLLYYMARTGHTGVFRGRHLFLTGSTALTPTGEAGRSQRPLVGDWSAITARCLPGWAEARLFEPGSAIASLSDWPAKVDAIINRTMTRDITLIAGVPPWVVAFAEAVLARNGGNGGANASLESIWPNLECFVHGGAPAAPYESELRALLGPTVKFHEIYAAAEGFFAAQDTAANTGLRLMANLGLFFEFVPFAEFDPARPEMAATKALPLDQVQVGVDYVMLLTTPAGVARYVNGDVVRFTSTEPPRLRYVGRTDLQLNAFGEQVLEKDVTDALLTVCQRHRWTIVNFHVGPLFGVNLTGQARGRHEWWIELRPGTVETPTGPQMAAELDVELQRLNREYAMRRGSGRIDAPTVRLVMPGVFRHWLKFHERLGGQNKVARCRSDRLVADELAQITKFACD